MVSCKGLQSQPEQTDFRNAAIVHLSSWCSCSTRKLLARRLAVPHKWDINVAMAA